MIFDSFRDVVTKSLGGPDDRDFDGDDHLDYDYPDPDWERPSTIPDPDWDLG